ncbi:MAG: restriction endonuclease subunit S, partial [Oscillibacter sp.]|nr:restriction endonuclease subunit S [Oscillibacter sp.]
MRRMKDSGVEWIGEIPENWNIIPMKYVSDIIMGQSPDGNDIQADGNILFMQGNREFGFLYPEPTLYCDKCSKHSRVGDILLSVRAPVGALNLSDKIYGIGRGLCSIKPIGINREYMYFYLLKSQSDFDYYITGTT